MFVDLYNKEVDDLIHQMVYGCNLPESSRREVNERLNSNPTNKLDPKIAAKIAARDKQSRKSKNKCMYALFFQLFTKLPFLMFYLYPIAVVPKEDEKINDSQS